MTDQIARGGSWLDLQNLANCNARFWLIPNEPTLNLGFRVIKKSQQGDPVLCGGSWDNVARYCRSAFRGRTQPGLHIDDLGFRVLKTKDRGKAQ